MVSAMLGAILDFTGSSFDLKDGEGLETIKVGDFSVWIEKGPLAVLAVVVHGSAPDELRMHLREDLESIHEQYAEALESFNGDAEPFRDVHPILESLLKIPAAGR